MFDIDKKLLYLYQQLEKISLFKFSLLSFNSFISLLNLSSNASTFDFKFLFSINNWFIILYNSSVFSSFDFGVSSILIINSLIFFELIGIYKVIWLFSSSIFVFFISVNSLITSEMLSQK